MRTDKLVLVGDFETTVYEGQKTTLVWASALVPLGSENVTVLHSIDDTFKYLKGLNRDVIVYYHNLKFDGSFWIDFLLRQPKLKPAYYYDKVIKNIVWYENKDMPNSSYKYVISNKGAWYVIYIKYRGRMIEIRDSLKLLPFSVKYIGSKKGFDTKHKKLEMEYTGLRYPGCPITDEEKKYISNDVLVVKEALEIMYKEGMNRLTIGSCCSYEFIRTLGGKKAYRSLMPDMTKEPVPEFLLTEFKNTDEYIRKAYRGGWCYLVHGCEGKMTGAGTVADVNSLYPSMMSSESGNRYPVGHPIWWSGNNIPEEARRPKMYYYIRIRTRFYLKPGMLPFIQIKGDPHYLSTDMLESSDIKLGSGEFSPYYYDKNGELRDTRVTMTMTGVDYELFRKHYNVVDFEILDGCYFSTVFGIFDAYIDHWRTVKINAKSPAYRTLAKLMLNNCYGKLAQGSDSSFKLVELGKNNNITFSNIDADDKEAGYIPIGAAITSYARRFTITAAQQNYYGRNKPGFKYADTDSIHCDLPADKIKGIKVHPKNFCCWKLETSFDKAIFVRQKTYIEHTTAENLEPLTEPYYNIKCAGMPEACKNLLKRNFARDKGNEKDSPEAIEFLSHPRTMADFKVGLKVPGKLVPKKITGGTLLVSGYYEMRSK